MENLCFYNERAIVNTVNIYVCIKCPHLCIYLYEQGKQDKIWEDMSENKFTWLIAL
jgi:hypothetical protein